MRQVSLLGLILLFGAVAIGHSPTRGDDSTPGLVGHWKLQGDCRDHSGHGNDGVNHGVDLATGAFDGRAAYIEVPPSDSLKFGAGDFAFAAWVYTEKVLDDSIGDILDLYDPSTRRGITWTISCGGGGYPGQGSERHVQFGIDNALATEWTDCGRPSPTSNYVSNSLTVFHGKLYAATIDAKDESGWAHVYCYEGDQRWTDCGRVGDRKTPGVGPLVVHNGSLYAGTSTYDWTRVRSAGYEPGRVYRYLGGTRWEDCGQPSDNRTLTCAASYKGRLYIGGGPNTQGVFVQEGEHEWQASKLFPTSGPRKCFPHCMYRYNGELFVAFPSAYAYDGEKWRYAGVTARPIEYLQTHSFAAYQGQLVAGTWPEAKVTKYLGGEEWREMGRVGDDGTEVNALMVYNGKLYGGSIPRAEVCRYDGEPRWTSLKRFYSPEGWTPVPPIGNDGHPTSAEVNEWARATSLAVYGGQMFVSIASCTSSVLDAPADVRGAVFSMEAGKCVCYDDDLGAGSKHVAAVRRGGKLALYVDGKLVAESTSFDPAKFDVSTDRPLRIGFGQTDYFNGRLTDVRAYNRALDAKEIQNLANEATRP